MTIKLMVLYTHPENPDDFDRRFLGTHLPLVKTLPGLQRAEIGRFVAAGDAEGQTYYRAVELYFEDQATLDAAYASDEGKATAAHYLQIAPPGSRMFIEAIDE